MPDKPINSNRAGDEPPRSRDGEVSLKAEVAESSQADAGGMKSIEKSRTNRHSGSASEDSSGDADSITIESIDKDGKRTIVASRLKGGSEGDLTVKEAAGTDTRNFNTQDLEAIQGDNTVPQQKRELAEQLQEMRVQAKEKGINTEPIDQFVNESFDKELNNLRQSQDDAGREEGGSFKAISPEQIDEKTFSLGLRYDVSESKPEAQPETQPETQAEAQPEVQEVFQDLASLPFDKQIQVLGTGIQVFHQELYRQELEIARGTFEGVGEGFEAIVADARTLVNNVGAVWQFGQDVMTNNPRALETGASAGEAIGKTLVGGVKLFEISHKYLYDIGYTGDYGKPFQDLSNLARELDRRWTELTPAEKAKLTAKLSTQFLGEAAVPLGAAKIAKSEKVVVALEEMAQKASVLGGKTRTKVVDGIADVVDGLTDMVTPAEELATAGGPGGGLRRQKLSEFISERRQHHDSGGGTRKLAQPADRPELSESASFKEEYLENPDLKGKLLGMLDDFGFNHKRRLERWHAEEAIRLKELADPLEAGISNREAADRAIEIMVKPWGHEDPKVKEHFELCKKALKESIPPDDIMALYGKGGEDAYSIHYPNKISDIDFGLSREKAFDYGDTRVHHLGGVTVPERKVTCVPRLRKDDGTGKWLMQKYVPETSETFEFVPDGVVRHEIAMSLMDIKGWKTPEGRLIYERCSASAIERRSNLVGRLTELETNSELFESVQQELTLFSRINDHLRRSSIGIEQTLADLYARQKGGSCHGERIDLFLSELFSDLEKHYGWQLPTDL